MGIAAESIATAYAAVVATIALGQEIHRRLMQGANLDVILGPGGAVVGGGASDEDDIVIVYVVNRGPSSTTTENLFLLEYEGRWSHWRRRPNRSFIVPETQLKGYPLVIPSQLQPNRQWTGVVRKAVLGSG